MTTAHQCHSLMRLFVFVALAFGFVGFLSSGRATVGAAPPLSTGAHFSLK